MIRNTVAGVGREGVAGATSCKSEHRALPEVYPANALQLGPPKPQGSHLHCIWAAKSGQSAMLTLEIHIAE